MFRTTTLLIAGALLVGCQESGVQGDYSYRPDVEGGTKYDNKVAGEHGYRHDVDRETRTDVDREGRISRTDAGGTRTDVGVDRGGKITRTDADVNREGKIARTDVDRNRAGKIARTDVDVTRDRNPRTDVDVDRTERAARTEGGVDRSGTITRTDAGARVTGPTTGDAERAAFSGTAKYPTDLQPSTDLRLTSVVDKSTNTVKIVNDSDQAMTDVKVWVDGSYMARVPAIPAHGTCSLKTSDFADASGKPLSDMTFKGTQIESGGKLYTVRGPVFDNR